jgi:hypothetical protein
MDISCSCISVKLSDDEGISIKGRLMKEVRKMRDQKWDG